MPLPATVLPKTDSLIRLRVNCPFCGFPFHPGDHVVFCPNDNTPHHAACWQQNGNHCTLLGCTGAGEIAIPAAPLPKGTSIVPFVVGGIVTLCIVGLLILGLGNMGIVTFGSSSPIATFITSRTTLTPVATSTQSTSTSTATSTLVRPTSTPTPMPTPTPKLPVLVGTSVPLSGETIAPDNTDRVTQLATLRGRARVLSVIFLPDGKMLASGTTDYTIELWEVVSGLKLQTLSGYTQRVSSIAFSPDGRMLVSGMADGSAKLWDVASGRELATLYGHTAPIPSVTFSPNGQILASGGAWNDNTIIFHDISSGGILQYFSGDHQLSVWCVALSRDGRLLASGGGEGNINLWDVTSGRKLHNLQGVDWVLSVTFSPDGKVLASGSEGRGTIRLWDVESGYKLATLRGHTHRVSSIAFSPDGRTLASGSYDNTIKLWDVASGRELRTLSGHTGSVNMVTFSPDGRTLASGSDDGTVRLWGVPR